MKFSSIVATIHWEQVAEIVRQNAFDLSADDMIQLIETSKVTSMAPPRGKLQRVLYHRRSELPALLSSRQSVETEIPLSQGAADVAHSVASRSHSPAPSIDGPGADDTGYAADPTDDPETYNSEQVSSGTYSEVDLRKINQAISNYLLRSQRRGRVSARPSKLAALRSHLFEILLAEAQRIPWSGHNFYRKLYLGPLLHILVCLEIALEWLRAQKTTQTKRLLDKDGDHIELDEIHAQLSKIK